MPSSIQKTDSKINIIAQLPCRCIARLIIEDNGKGFPGDEIR